MTKIIRVTQLNEKGIKSLNEDSILVDRSNSIFGVFDGASALDSFMTADNKTGAYIASHLASVTFRGTTKKLSDTLALASHRIEEVHHKFGIDTSNSVHRFSTTVAVVKILDDEMEMLQVGDSLIIIIDEEGCATAPFGYHDHDIEVMKLWRKFANEGRTNIRQLVEKDVIKLRESSNKTYGTLNGDGMVAKFAQNKTVSLGKISTVLIISDGMFIPKTNPEAEEDWSYYAKLYRSGGLKRIYQEVREIEKSDTEITKYPRYKIHDDASGVAIDFDNS